MLSPSLQAIFPDMDDFCGVLGHQQDICLEEMKQKLFHAYLELEKEKMEAGDELKKHKVYNEHLLGLLQIANQERDDARVQLKKLLDKLSFLNPSFDEVGNGSCPVAFSFGIQQPDSNHFQGKSNSGVTESNNSYSPVESLMEAVSSPDSCSMVIVDQRSNGYLHEIAIPKVDPTAGIIDELAKGKSLPQKGNLLEAVQNAGPLLINLLVAGPLPRWKNPPPIQPIRAPPVIITNGCESSVSGSSCLPVPSLTRITSRKRSRLALCNDMPCGNAQLSFMGSTNNMHPQPYGMTMGQLPVAIRQRLH